MVAPGYGQVRRGLYRRLPPVHPMGGGRPCDSRETHPNFGPLAKRPTISNGYLKAYNRNNVTLVTEPIERITKRASARAMVSNTDSMFSFSPPDMRFFDPETYRPGAILGRNGFDLASYYGENGLQAYESVAVHGLPNRWTLCGPYSWTGSGWHAFMEMTSDHAVRAILRPTGAARIAVRYAKRSRTPITTRSNNDPKPCATTLPN